MLTGCKYVDTEHFNKMFPDKGLLFAKISSLQHPVFFFSKILILQYDIHLL